MEPIQLTEYKLWADGTIEVEPERAASFVMRLAARKQPLSKLAVTRMTPDVEAYNDLSGEKIRVKQSLDLTSPDWVLPERYKYLDVVEYLLSLAEKIEHDALYEKRVARLGEEITLFLELELQDVLRTLIYVLDTFRAKGVVWGVGRGSSCSSYLLFLLGLHEVDPVKYEIAISDFLKPTGD